MFTVYQPKKSETRKGNKWYLQHPTSNAQIGWFKTRKAAMEYVVKTMAAIINK